MADEKDEKLENEEGEEPKKKKKGKGMLLIVIIAAASIAAGAGLYFAVFSKSGGEAKKEEKKAEEAGVVFALEPFVVNLSDPTGTRFLKVTMQIEVAGPAVMEKAKAKTPQLRDAIITLLTSKSADALISPEGKLQLKDELNIRANQILGENSVKNVYLTDFVMQ
jgi:flagellar FliL protein